MKKCIVCKVKMSEEDENLCYTCLSFFQWKYKEDFSKWLEKTKEYYAGAKKKRPIKCRRLNK